MYFEFLCAVFWASDQVVRVFDCCAEDRWLEANPRAIILMLTSYPPSGKWVSAGKSGRRGKELATLPQYANGSG